MTHIDTLDVAEFLAAQVDGEFNDELSVFIGASAVKSETGRIVLSVLTQTNEGEEREFKFIGGEVTR